MRHIWMIVVLLFGSTAEAQTFKAWDADIALKVTADEPLKSRIVSFMSRELRSIPGVTLVDEKPEWILSVVAVSAGGNTAISLGIATTYTPYVDALKEKITDATLKAYLAEMENAVHVRSNAVRIFPTDQLDKECKDIVAEFDGGLLEANRKAYAKATGQKR